MYRYGLWLCLIAKLAMYVPMSLYDYDHWGVTAVWKCGVGELQLVISFTTIEWNLEASVCFEMLRKPYSIVIGIHVTNSPFS